MVVIPSSLNMMLMGGGAPGPTVYSAWNPLDKNTPVTLSNGDRTATVVSAGSSYGAVRGVQGRDADGDFAFEILVGGDHSVVGIGLASATITNAYPGSDANGRGYWGFNGQKVNNLSFTAYGGSYANGDTVGVRINAGVLTFYKNGTSQGAAFTGLSGIWYPMWGPASGNPGTRSATINTGQAAFTGSLADVNPWG